MFFKETQEGTFAGVSAACERIFFQKMVAKFKSKFQICSNEVFLYLGTLLFCTQELCFFTVHLVLGVFFKFFVW